MAAHADHLSGLAQQGTIYGSSPGVPMMMPPLQPSPGHVDISGGHPTVPYTSPYVLVPASALPFLHGFTQPVMPPQGGPGQSFPPYGFGGQGNPDSVQERDGLGRSHVGHISSVPSGAPASPECTADSELAASMQRVTLSDSRRVRGAGAKRKFKRPCPEELEDARQRTVYVSDVDKGITETALVRWFAPSGTVTECRICSDINTSKRFAFVEFADKHAFEKALRLTGEKLNGNLLKISPSKTPIVPINRDFMPRDDKELERCERTVYVNQIDRAVPGSAVEAMFENFCGAIEHVKLKLDRTHNTRIAFIEFKTSDAAKIALGMCGAQLGSSQIRVSPSKTPVRIHGSP